MEREPKFLPHCEDRIKERGIDKELAKKTIFEPEQVISEGKRTIFHRRYKDKVRNKEYLLRVFVEKKGKETEVVSVYRTSKIQKYWRQER